MSQQVKEYFSITCDNCGKEELEIRRPNCLVFGGWFRLEKRIGSCNDKVKEYDLCSKECVIEKLKKL